MQTSKVEILMNFLLNDGLLTKTQDVSEYSNR